MAYSEVDDLLTGSIPLPRGLDPQKFVDDAADEIDGALGQIYLTPIMLPTDDPAVRPSFLILKRVNNFIASGRLIMAADSGGQDQRVHAYALSLLNEARETLTQLRASSDTLPGATPLPPKDVTEEVLDVKGAPRIYNQDPHSNVDAFYEYMKPGSLRRLTQW